MKITPDDFHHGAALRQLAEHPRFDSLQRYRENGEAVPGAYVANRRIGIYVRSRAAPDREYEEEGRHVIEYRFQFDSDERGALARLEPRVSKLYLILVCAASGQVCCIRYSEFLSLLARRAEAAGPEDQVAIFVALHGKSKFRVFVIPPRSRNKRLGVPFETSQTIFPDRVFSEPT